MFLIYRLKFEEKRNEDQFLIFEKTKKNKNKNKKLIKSLDTRILTANKRIKALCDRLDTLNDKIGILETKFDEKGI